MIGIGITTTPERNALDLLNWRGLIPQGAELVIFTDTGHFGVAYAKNRLLKQLQDCDDIFLFDDDTWPIADEWWKPYIESKEPHLMYQFKLPGKPSSDMKELYRDDKIVSYSHTRGAMIYIHRSVLDVVGGFNTAYGLYGYEHADYTNRIHNAGLTTHRAMDVTNSHELLYCLDQDAWVTSSVPDDVRKQQLSKNHALYRKNRLSKEFQEYRT